MLDHFLRNRAAAERLRANPIGSHLDGFTAWLSQQGFALLRRDARLQLFGPVEDDVDLLPNVKLGCVVMLRLTNVLPANA